MIRTVGCFLVAMLVLTGCSSASITQGPPPTASPAAPTSVAAEVSPSPEASTNATPANPPTDQPTAMPTPAPTEKPPATATTAATATPAATASPAATATPIATATPAATATATPAATPTSRAQACSDTADHKKFFADAAAQLSFDVYCAVLPSGWWLHAASYTAAGGGYLEVSYSSATAVFTVREGRTCPPEKACIAYGAHIGPASFGGLAGELYSNGSTYSLVVSTARPYVMYGSGMTQAKFVALAATFVKVPKS